MGQLGNDTIFFIRFIRQINPLENNDGSKLSLDQKRKVKIDIQWGAHVWSNRKKNETHFAPE